ncbi:hypothetical protein C8Q76DRAFT_793517 [Earliella scabrosa]|nr:hypothetical protein C8Q76DRAFT_793517 [Earliella scabrosa]
MDVVSAIRDAAPQAVSGQTGGDAYRSLVSHGSDDSEPHVPLSLERPLQLFDQPPSAAMRTTAVLASSSTSTAAASATRRSEVARARRARKAKKPEAEVGHLRKRYFNSTAVNVGFPVTDPDEITCHGKKRAFLEGLEEYVEWLEEQMRAAGLQPAIMEKDPVYRVPELRTRSTRIVLIQKQRVLRELHLKKQQLESEYAFLQNLAPMRCQSRDEEASTAC